MRALRKKTGSAITETGPALWLFFILIFFPMLDVLGLACQYGCGWYLNHIASREVACRRATLSGQACTDAENDFKGTGLANFLGIDNIVNTATFAPGTAPGGASGKPGDSVICTTTITARPFISVPLPIAVPGLTTGMNLVYQSARPREDLRN